MTFGPLRDSATPNLSGVQRRALVCLYTTGQLGAVRRVTIECLIHEGCIVENAYGLPTITREAKDYLDRAVAAPKWFPQEVL